MRAIDATTPVVTGTGLVTALGFDVAATFDALLAGRTGIVPTGDVAIESGAGLAALVERPFLRAEPPDELRTQVKFLNGAGELATQAAHDAWRDAVAEGAAAPEASGLWLSQMDTWDWPCVDFQTAVRDATDDLTRPLEAEALNRSSVRRTKPFFLLDSLKNNAFSFVTRWWSLRGANTGVAGFAGPTLGLLDLAARAIARGDQERALVVAAARAANGVLRRDLVLHGLSRPSGDPAYRPLDSRGTGCVLGEAAAALTVERHETANARGAEVRAILLGYAGVTGEPLAAMPLAPRTETLRAAAAGALERAGVEAGDLLGVVLPALGLPEADAAMLAALDDLPAAAGAPAVSWRGALGHTALAAELAEVVLAAEALRTGRLPGTVGLAEPLPAGRPLPTEPVGGDGRAVLVLTAGLQGEAAAVVVGSA
jgi:3-oxoacyl-[acyl-carrier-protein] synthase II